MIFRPKIYFRDFTGVPPVTPPVDPPDPEPIVETAGGWADTHPDGPVTGGAGGDVLYFNENSSVNGKTGFNALWETLALNLLTPLTLVWTGGTVNMDPINYGINGTSGNVTVGKPQNKTIMGSAGQLLRGGGGLYISGWRNIILRNFTRRGDGLGGDTEGGITPIHGGKGMTIRTSERIWIDHMEVDGEATIPGTEMIKDGSIDQGNAADYITYSNCYIRRSNKTSLISGSDTSFGDRGKLRITFRNCLWENNHIRQPFARFGKIHLLNNVFRYNPVYTNSADQYDWARIIEIGVESTFYSQGNKYYGHRYCFLDRDWDNQAALSGLISDGDWFDSAPHDFNRFYGIGINGYAAGSVRTANVTWNPNTMVGYNYPLGLMTPNDAESYVLQWAGAKYHLKNPIV